MKQGTVVEKYMVKWHHAMLKTQATGISIFFSVLPATFPWQSVSLVLLTLMGRSMLYISEEDKNEKGATADSVQQRRQYRRQNRQSSSGYKRFYPRSVLPYTQLLSLTKSLSMSSCTHRLMDF